MANLNPKVSGKAWSRWAFVSAFFLVASMSWASPPQLRIVYFEDFSPFCSGRGSTVKGIFVDMAKELGKRVGFDVTNYGYPWQRAQMMVRKGEADAFMTVATPGRMEYVNAGSVPVLVDRNVAVTAKNNPLLSRLRAISSLADAKKYRLVTYRGDDWAKDHLGDAQLEYVVTVQAAMQFIADGRGDLMIEDVFTLQKNIHDLHLDSKLELLPYSYETLKFVFCIRKTFDGGPALLGLIDAELSKMREDGTMARIFHDYGVNQ